MHVRRHRTSDLPELLPLMSSRSSLQRHFGIVTKEVMACICDLDLAGAAKEQHWKCLIANGVANKNQKDFVRLPDLVADDL